MKPLIDNETLFDLLDSRKKPAGMRTLPDNILPAFENAGTGSKRAAIHLYDAISFWTGNDAKSFKNKLDAINAEVIELHINSPGGGVFEGVTIYNLLVAHPARVEVHIDGLAASIASVIALAGDEVHIAENAMFMIHNPSTVMWGESGDMRKAADVLDKLKDAILNTYVSRTGMDRNELARAMDKETWYSADEAVTHKFAHKKVTSMKAAAFWNGDDFPGIPENLRGLFGKKPATAISSEPDKPGDNEPPAPPAPDPAPPKAEEQPVSKGTIEDVAAARDRIAKLRKLHGL